MTTDDVVRNGFPLQPRSRVLLVCWSLFLLGGFSVAWMLQPNPRGFGTHRGIGLPPCTFREVFGIPCPSCGMTTSFAHFVRGHFVDAARANVAGLFLAVACAVQIPWCWISAGRGRTVWIERPEHSFMCLMMAVCIICLLQWIPHIFLQ
ncbi:MAG: DUF2752 domain-containing protein [Planctomycetes bacterium]|nr:DUF2752 domain-containing protein [Planctomycetota bacterium]